MRRIETVLANIFGVIFLVLAFVVTIETLIGLRFLQGMGGAMVMATAMAMVVSVFPPEERGKALGITVASVYAGISCGPYFGGALVTELGWRWIFYLCIPTGTAVFLITCARLRGEWADAAGEPFDWRGSLVYAAALLLLIAGAANLNRGSWAWGLALSGLASLALFLILQARIPYPILDISLLLGNRVFAFSSLAALLNYAATFGVTFFLSLYLQFVKGMSAREAGSILIIQPIVQTLLSPLCGRLADRYPAGLVATVGMAFCAVGLGVAATLAALSPLAKVFAVLIVLGFGFAFFSSPNTSVIMGSVGRRHLGVASGMVGTMRTLGMMTSMTIITVIFSVFMSEHAVTPDTLPAFLRSMHTALLVFSGLCGVGIFFSLARLRRPAG